MNLFEQNQNFEFINGSALGAAFLGVASSDHLKEDHLVLISEKKFYEQLLESLDKKVPSKLGLLFSESFFLKIQSDERWQKVKKEFPWIILAKDFSLALVELSRFFHQKAYEKIDLFVDGREDKSADIHSSVRIGNHCFIGQNVVIEEGATIHPHCHIGANSYIGEETEIFPHTTLYPFSKVGKKCRFHSQVTLGADGFGYQFTQGMHAKVWHFGGVDIGDNVEIGANSCVDGGTFSPTRVGDGSKIDNHVQVGHNCQIGKHVLLCGQVGLGGSTKLEDYVVFGGKAGCGPSIELGQGCQVGGGGLVNNSWPAGTKLGGHPARPLKEWMKGLAYIRKASLEKNKEA